MRDWLQRALWDVAPTAEPVTAAALRRRQVTTAVVVIIGSIVLGASLRIEPGSPWFYPAALTMAATWAIGAVASGPLHLGRIAVADQLRRPIASPILLGLALAGVFVVGALVVRRVPVLAEEVSTILEHADRGSLPLLMAVTAVTGLAEELFFRGAAYAAIPRYPVAVTTAAYAVATLATGNVMLAFAAMLLGFVVGLERRASGGILAPALTHVTWSLAMLVTLPMLFA
ncbi:MAG TPA: CPBP family glutamic-type intramembrane protease [Aeromicrobium sp.]|nr:CPBP family glutamic-type intramembrane protease [Aeromicrobium sp.]HKY56831.1 CPBP family glutamic-type intramembrane protease [Aeromicrobium sp.]